MNYLIHVDVYHNYKPKKESLRRNAANPLRAQKRNSLVAKLYPKTNKIVAK